MNGRTEQVRTRLRDTHGGILRAIDEAAAAVAADWTGDGIADRTRVVEPFREAMADRGVLMQAPDVLADLVETAGFELAATPVSAPPYIVVTSTGLLLRGSMASGRLVIAIEPFEIGRGRPTTYSYRGDVALDVRWAER